MGKKTNPFGEFVKAEHDLMRKSDPNFRKSLQQMFGDPSMNKKWSSMSEDSRQHYKDIAASKNDGTYNYKNFHHGPKSVHRSNEESLVSISDRPAENQQVSVRPDMSVQPKNKLGVPGLPNSKKMAKLRQEGKEMPLPDEMTYEHMPSYRLYNRCMDIIYSCRNVEELIEKPLYAFSCNVMCTDNGTEDLYIPLEIAIYSYSVKNGRVKDLYLTFVNPGPPPQGKMGEAKDHYTDSKHCVPFEPSNPFLEYARTDYREIYKEILEYVGEERIILCQQADYLQQIHGVLRWLAKKANEKPERSVGGLIRARQEQLAAADTWTVFDIKDYAFIFGKRLKSPLPSDVYISMLLESLNHAYLEDNNCEWHNAIENETKWCAKSCAKRMIANIADLLEWFKTNYEKQLVESKSLEAEPTTVNNLVGIITQNPSS